MSSIEVRERLTKEQFERKQRNARVLNGIERDNARVGRDLAQRQSDLVRETVDRYRRPLVADTDGVAIRDEKGMLEDMRRYAQREGIADGD